MDYIFKHTQNERKRSVRKPKKWIIFLNTHKTKQLTDDSQDFRSGKNAHFSATQVFDAATHVHWYESEQTACFIDSHDMLTNFVSISVAFFSSCCCIFCSNTLWINSFAPLVPSICLTSHLSILSSVLVPSTSGHWGHAASSRNCAAKHRPSSSAGHSLGWMRMFSRMKGRASLVSHEVSMIRDTKSTCC
jgi:hypothetical protein